jgi:hypothetical protein
LGVSLYKAYGLVLPMAIVKIAPTACVLPLARELRRYLLFALNKMVLTKLGLGYKFCSTIY